jgi:hypothetical protein
VVRGGGRSMCTQMYIIQQNVKLMYVMMEACIICKQTRSSVKNSLSQIQFSVHLRQIVFFPNCSICSRPTDLQTAIEDVFTDNANENIIFKQWILTYKCELITIVKSTKNSCNDCWKNCHSYIIIHSLRNSKLCPSKNLNVI